MKRCHFLGWVCLFAFVGGVGFISSPDAAAQRAERFVEKEGGFSYVPPAGSKLSDKPNDEYKVHCPIPGGGTAWLKFRVQMSKSRMADYVADMKKSSEKLKDYKLLAEKKLKTG